MKKNSSTNPLILFLAKNYLSFGFLITAIASIASIFLSEVMQLIPCDLCWYQRSVMYPLAILFGIALWKNDKAVSRYILPIAGIGFAIAVYHILLQFNPTVIPCTSSASSCATKQIEVFGFDAIPLMSGLSFASIIALTLLAKRFNK